jgi:hypothetical protein
LAVIFDQDQERRNELRLISASKVEQGAYGFPQRNHFSQRLCGSGAEPLNR